MEAKGCWLLCALEEMLAWTSTVGTSGREEGLVGSFGDLGTNRDVWFRRRRGAQGEDRGQPTGGSGQPRGPRGGSGSETCDGSFAERTVLVRQGAGPRAGGRARMGAREGFQATRALAGALGRTGQHHHARGLENNTTSLPRTPRNYARGAEAESCGAGVRARAARGGRGRQGPHSPCRTR